jgi:hypothetical protein
LASVWACGPWGATNRCGFLGISGKFFRGPCSLPHPWLANPFFPSRPVPPTTIAEVTKNFAMRRPAIAWPRHPPRTQDWMMPARRGCPMAVPMPGTLHQMIRAILLNPTPARRQTQVRKILETHPMRGRRPMRAPHPMRALPPTPAHPPTRVPHPTRGRPTTGDHTSAILTIRPNAPTVVGLSPTRMGVMCPAMPDPSAAFAPMTVGPAIVPWTSPSAIRSRIGV